jgi:hypothetical protein
MGEINVDKIRLGKLFCIKSYGESPSAVKGSEYGDSYFKVGYLKDEKFIDKNNNEYNVFKLHSMSSTARIYFEGDKPRIGETFVDLSEDHILDFPCTVSSDKISFLLDSIERLYYQRLSSRERVDFKEIVGQEYNDLLLRIKKH